jgi:hypothetical protein
MLENTISPATDRRQCIVPWCASSHGWDETTPDGDPIRTHSISGEDFWTTGDERHLIGAFAEMQEIRKVDGTHFGPLRIHADLDGALLTPRQARAIASILNVLADKVDAALVVQESA